MPAAKAAARWALVWLALFAVLPATGHADGAVTAAPFSSQPLAELAGDVGAVLPTGFTDTAIRTGLVAPTAVRWAPDGRIFVAQKSGRIVVYDSLADTTPTLYADLSREVDDFIDRGMLGLAIDPKFDSGRPYIYALYTYDKDPNSTRFPAWNDDCPDPPGADGFGCPVLGRLARIDPDGTEHVLIQDWCSVYSTHTIGDVNFGADGALYASGGDGAHYQGTDYGAGGGGGTPANACGDPPNAVGDGQSPPTAEGGALRSQSFRRPAGEAVSLDGSIVRVSPDTGDALPDNPAAGDANANRRRIVAYGFRNPFRFTFRPSTGELWVADVGWNTWEEIDRDPDTSTVRNFGWPCYEGQGRQDAYDSLDLTQCETLYAQGSSTDPWFQYSHGEDIGSCSAGTSSPTGVAFYTGTQFPAEYRNALFAADYARQCLYVFFPGSGGAPDPRSVSVFAWGAGTPVDLQQGPDGALYYADIAAGTINRIAYPAGEHVPVARATATPDHGPTPLTVSFDGTGSTDPDGSPLTYSWDLDGDGAFGDSTSPTPTYTYTTPGNYTARLRVSDTGGSTAVAVVPITAGDPPTVTIDSPATGFSWAVGDPIAYAGHATDSEGHAIPASGLQWRLDIRHCARTDTTSCHTHPGATIAAVSSGTFVAPNHDWPSHLDLVLTATDSHGLTASKTMTLQPKTANLTLVSTPAGGRLTMGSDTGTSPFTETFIQNATTTISAVSPQTIGGASYAFGSWSDGGAITHEITIPRSDSTLTATLVPDTSVTLAGAEAVGTSVSRAPSGAAEVYRITAAKTGTVSRLRLYVDGSSTATALTLGLYDDQGGQPGRLLASGARQGVDAGAWNEVPLATPVPVTAGASYWFALLNPLASTGTLAWRDHAGGQSGQPEQTSADRALTGLPATWAAQAAYSDGPVSGYAVGSDGGSPSTPALSVSPTSLAFSATAGAGNPAAKTLTVSNTGSGTLDFTTSDDAPWLSVTPTSGTADRDVTVSVDTTGLAAGTYSANVTVDGGSATGSPKVVPVTLTVSAPPPPGTTTLAGSEQVGTNLSEAPAGAGEVYRITAAASGTASKLRLYVDGSTAARQLVLGIYADSGGQPTTLLGSGQIAAVTPGAWNEVALSSGVPLVAGTAYWFALLNPSSSGGVLRWRDHAGGAGGGAEQTSQGRNLGALPGTWAKLGSYTDGPVSGYVVGATGPPPPPMLAVAPSSLTFDATAGGANPPAQTLAVSNTGSGTLDFTASDDAPWLAVSPASGTAPRDLSVAVDASGLAVGTYTATVTVDAGTASGSPRTIPVTLTVKAPTPPVLAVSPSTLSFSATQGAPAPAAQTVSVSNTGGGTLSYTVSDDQPWLSASPTSGTAPGSVDVSVNPAGLAPGSYTGTVTITAPGASGSPKTIAVGLAVAAPSTGLVGAWGFNEASGATAVDASGKGNAGTITGAARTTAGKFGGALSFTADGNWVTVADSASLHLTTGLTIEGWAKPTVGSQWRALAVKETPSGLAWALYPFDDGGFPSGNVFTSSELWARGTTKVPLNTWSHLAVTYDGSTIRLFLNGVQVATRAQTGPLVSSTRPLRFGGDAVWGEWFRGTLDEIRVYDRPLSGAEIQTDMATAIGGT